MSKLVIEMTADEAKLFTSMQKLIRKQQEVEKGFKKIGKTQKKAAADGENATKRTAQALKRTTKALKDQQRANQELLSSVTSLAGGYFGIQSAARLATAAMREHQAFKEKVSQTQLDIAPARAAAVRNFGRAKPGEFEAFEKSIAEISKETGVGQAKLFLAASTALSTRGTLSRDDALKAVQLAAKISPDSPDEFPAIAGGILDLAKISGTTDPRANLGFLTAVGEAAEVTTLKLQTKNIVPGLIGVVKSGGTLRTAGALVAGLSQVLGDQEGARSATAAVALARQLKVFLPGDDVFDSNDKLVKQGTGFTNLSQRIAALQNDPKSRKQFFESGVSFELQSKGPIEELLRGSDTPAGREFSSAFAKLPSPEDAAPFATDIIATIESGPIAAHSRLKRTIDTQIAAARAVDTKGADEALIRSMLGDISEIAGNNFFGRGINRAAFEIKIFDGTKSPRQALTEIIESDIQLIEHGGVTEKESGQLEALNGILTELQNMGGRRALNNAQGQLNAHDE